MTDTAIPDAVVNPEDEGTGLTNDSADYISAGFEALPRPPSKAILGGCSFTVDYTTPSFDLEPGIVQLPNSAISVQSGSQQSFDTDLPVDGYQTIILPTSVTGLSLQDSDLNEVYLYHDPTSQDSVTVRHGGGVSEPTEPHIKIGEILTDSDEKREQWHLNKGGLLSYPDETTITIRANVNMPVSSTLVVNRSTGAFYEVDANNNPRDIVAQPDIEQSRSPLTRKHHSITALDDGESLEIPIRLLDGEPVGVRRWGAYKVADGTAPTGLDVEFLDGSDTVQASANTVEAESTFNYTNGTGSPEVVKLRVINSTGSAINSPGVAAFFGWQFP